MEGKKLYLYLVSQNEDTGWDTYISFVVASVDEESARQTHPHDPVSWEADEEPRSPQWRDGCWSEYWKLDDMWVARESRVWTNDMRYVTVQKLGIADAYLKDGQIVCANFKAG